MKKLVYVVPLIAPGSCCDWEQTARLCRRTVKCLLAGNGELHVFLVCNKSPRMEPNSRLTIVEQDFPIPNCQQNKLRDKYSKIKAGLLAARDLAPFWLMKADADDLVSTKIPRFVAQLPNGASGALVTKGYLNRVGSRVLKVCEKFHIRCGTSNIIWVERDDLPRTMNSNDFESLPMRLGHNITAQYFEERGNPLTPVPFPGAIYTVGHRDNYSGAKLFFRSRRHLLRELSELRLLTPRIRREFAV